MVLNRAIQAELPRRASKLAALAAAGALFLSVSAVAEIYIYQGPNGERLVSDRPVKGYTLLTQRDTFNGAGHILAQRMQQREGLKAFNTHIRIASDKYMVDPALIEAIIEVESSFRPDAVSRSGATGLMQLMPATARDLAVTDRFDPRQNIHGGVKYISQLLQRFDNDLTLAVAAYNAGPVAVERARGVPARAETQRYVKKVMKAYENYRLLRYESAE